jgi:hypothetical protein
MKPSTCWSRAPAMSGWRRPWRSRPPPEPVGRSRGRRAGRRVGARHRASAIAAAAAACWSARLLGRDCARTRSRSRDDRHRFADCMIPCGRCSSPSTARSRRASPSPTWSPTGAERRPAPPREELGVDLVERRRRRPVSRTGRRRDAVVLGRRPDRGAAARRRRRREVAAARHGRHPDGHWDYGQSGIVARSRMSAAWRPRRGAFPAGRPVRHPAAEGQPLLDRVDRARRRTPSARRRRPTTCSRRAGARFGLKLGEIEVEGRRGPGRSG